MSLQRCTPERQKALEAAHKIYDWPMPERRIERIADLLLEQTAEIESRLATRTAQRDELMAEVERLRERDKALSRTNEELRNEIKYLREQDAKLYP